MAYEYPEPANVYGYPIDRERLREYGMQKRREDNFDCPDDTFDAVTYGMNRMRSISDLRIGWTCVHLNGELTLFMHFASESPNDDSTHASLSAIAQSLLGLESVPLMLQPNP
ncbi:hypothetical protein Clacol_007755 [Clathrus columnatus]|uniref:Uncharacterized protein n=1 Tax=Clathrus columnatus TaxID=1419009 RepID=A0AAV5AFT1_9AGAM|nr:hypothetical protein Clacol_007755 [Clathrus columnatus]